MWGGGVESGQICTVTPPPHVQTLRASSDDQLTAEGNRGMKGWQ